jgi:hypothetical protein
MATTDPIQLPFRWEFVPVEDPGDRSVRWAWKAYANTGAIAMQSGASFDSLTECMDDAKEKGYGSRR